MDLAQAVESAGGSSTLLAALMSGALVVTATGIYRFVVKLRVTERGINRKRMRDANLGERKAQYEAALWQGRAGDLEFELRRHGKPIPQLQKELAELVATVEAEEAASSYNDEPTGGRPAP